MSDGATEMSREEQERRLKSTGVFGVYIQPDSPGSISYQSYGPGPEPSDFEKQKAAVHAYDEVVARAERIRAEHILHPQHYTFGSIECLSAIQSALNPDEFRGFLKGQIIKYTWRERHKNGREDMEKAEFYLKKLLEVMR